MNLRPDEILWQPVLHVVLLSVFLELKPSPPRIVIPANISNSFISWEQVWWQAFLVLNLKTVKNFLGKNLHFFFFKYKMEMTMFTCLTKICWHILIETFVWSSGKWWYVDTKHYYKHWKYHIKILHKFSYTFSKIVIYLYIVAS